MSAEIRLQGAIEFQEKLKLAMQRAPDRIEEKLVELGNEVRKRTQAKTPVGTTKLRRSFRLTHPESLGNEYQIGLYSRAPHFHLVERGHRIVTKSGKEAGFKPGVFMLETSVKEVEQELQSELENWMDELFKELIN